MSFNDTKIKAHDLFYGVHADLIKEWNDKTYVLYHYPIYSWFGQGKGSYHIYGHTHADLLYHKNAICVSLECHDEFRPFNLDEINYIIQNRKDEHFIGFNRPNIE